MGTEGRTHSIEPTPGTAPRSAVSAFAAALRDLKVLSDFSLRDLQRRTGLPRSTIANTLNPNRASLPPWERTEAILRALNVPEHDLAGWRKRWIQAQREAGPDPVGPEPCPVEESPTAEPPAASSDGDPSTPGRDRTGVRSGPVRRLMTRWRKPGASHLVALLLGLALGWGLAVSNQTSPPEPPRQTPVTSAPVGSAGLGRALPAWVSRPASDAEIQEGTTVDLPITTSVASGDSLIVSVMLTSVCPGDVTVTDTQRDDFRIVGDVTDTLRHRTLLLAAFSVHALSTADSVHVVYPHVSKYHVAVDEFRGISAALQHAHGSGEKGNAAFTTNKDPLACRRGDLLVSAVGTNSGSGAEFAADWKLLPVLKLSSYRLSTAYRVIPADQTCAATGSTTGQWGAVAVVFR
jgi:transcriptional regulator with XRE-family HTH domain